MNDAVLQETGQPKTSADCAWCATIFDDLVDLLAHVESCHLDTPHSNLDAAA